MSHAKDVHTEHCCSDHGCCYNKGTACPVVSGDKPQSHPCDLCDFIEREIKSFIPAISDKDLLSEIQRRGLLVEVGWKVPFSRLVHDDPCADPAAESTRLYTLKT